MLTYRTPAEIIGHDGLRIVLVRGVPSPWSQARRSASVVGQSEASMALTASRTWWTVGAGCMRSA